MRKLNATNRTQAVIYSQTPSASHRDPGVVPRAPQGCLSPDFDGASFVLRGDQTGRGVVSHIPPRLASSVRAAARASAMRHRAPARAPVAFQKLRGEEGCAGACRPAPRRGAFPAPSQGLLNLSLTLTSHLYHPIFQTGERPASRRLWPEPDSFPTWVSSGTAAIAGTVEVNSPLIPTTAKKMRSRYSPPTVPACDGNMW